MPTQYNASGVSYSSSTVRVDGRKSNFSVLSPSVLIGGSSSIRVSKITDSAFLTLSAREVRSLLGTVVIYQPLTATISVIQKKTKLSSTVLSASAASRVSKTFSSGFSTSSSLHKLANKVLDASVVMTTFRNKIVYYLFDVALTILTSGNNGRDFSVRTSTALVASYSASIHKGRATSLSLVVATNKYIMKGFSIASALSSSISRFIGKVSSASTTLYVAKLKLSNKFLRTYIEISSSENKFFELWGGVTLAFTPVISFSHYYRRAFNAISTLVGKAYKRSPFKFGSGLTLSSDKTKKTGIIKDAATSFSSECDGKKADFNTFVSIVYIGASQNKLITKSMGAEMSLESEEEHGKSCIINIGIDLEEYKAVKRVGKVIKIREHSPSVWHNC